MDTSSALSSVDPVARVDLLLRLAFDGRATDIHLEPFAQGARARMRVDGLFRLAEELDRKTLERMIGRIRVLAHLPSYECMRPQEGRIDAETSGLPVDIRVSIIPAVGGEKAVLRFMNQQGLLLRMEDLGFQPDVLQALRQVRRWRWGLILVCGPSGSGKTTTLYALTEYLMRERGEDWQFVSVEDPVERRIPGMTQVEVKPQFELGFPSALKYLLRQDPEVILVGEIRDAETAAMAVQAAFTGHLVLSSMHVGHPQEAMLRLQRMGLPEYQIEAAVRMIVSQRLLRRKCPSCVSGCPQCSETGYAGLVPIGEVFHVGETSPDGRSAHAMEGLKAAAEHLIQAGVTTHDEAERVLE
jgi:general secretion pathway protein E